MHRVLQYTQNNWLTSYITLSSENRQAASKKIENSFYKLMNKAFYGKNCESKRRRMKIELLRDARRTLTIVRKFEFDKFKVFGENMAALSSRPKKIYWDTPTIVGATILDLAKYYMYQFHYGTMRSSIDFWLLYSDTDSLLYRINCEDLYRELKESNVLDQFDFSNYPEVTNCTAKKKTRRLKVQRRICWELFKKVYMSEAKAVQHYFRCWVFYV